MEQKSHGLARDYFATAPQHPTKPNHVRNNSTSSKSKSLLNSQFGAKSSFLLSRSSQWQVSESAGANCLSVRSSECDSQSGHPVCFDTANRSPASGSKVSSSSNVYAAPKAFASSNVYQNESGRNARNTPFQTSKGAASELRHFIT